ncbi:hypothetical protein ACFV7Q_11535 [Streptomyces sp. NPDC059851]|uniref:hypothetical protein n=1 Tax=Streptomyces sp. NPDC059851 TaxID=3346971 RepID=UPI00365B7163
MTARIRGAAALAALAAGAALLLTGCGGGEESAPAGQSEVADLQQKLDAAEQAASEADRDASEGN